MTNKEKVANWPGLMFTNSIKQKDLAEATGIAAPQLSLYMTGKVMPSALVIDKIEAAIGEMV